MRKKKILSIVMSVIMILAMVPSVAFAADAPYDVWAYKVGGTVNDKVVLDDLLVDGKTEPNKADVLAALKDADAVDDNVTEDELEIKFYNGDNGNIKKMLNGKGVEYGFKKTTLRLDHIAMTYEVVEPEFDGTVSFNIYSGTDKADPVATISKDFKNGQTYEDIAPTDEEVIEAFTNAVGEPEEGKEYSIKAEWLGNTAWTNKDLDATYDLT